MREFKTVSLADQVFEKLENGIITGTYARGEVLTELMLVEQLGVSRTPIREALRRLEQERLIKDSGKGSVVLGITAQDLLDIMDIRERTECLAAYYATVSITPEKLQHLQQICELQDFYFQKRDIEKLREMDDRFHNAIYDLAGRAVIRDTLLPLHKKSTRYRKISIQDDKRLKASVKEHRDIFEAIKAADADLAAKLMSQHIANAKISMIARYRQDG